MALDNEQALFEGSGYYPMGYTMLYCVANVDDCGASIPLYRYYSPDLQGISSFFFSPNWLIDVLKQYWLFIYNINSKIFVGKILML